jgi:hypothetical protein
MLFVLVVLILTFAAYHVGGLFAQWRAATPPAPQSAQASTVFSPLAGALSRSGVWSFAGAEWNIQSRLVASSEINDRLTALSRAKIATVGYPNVAPEVLRMIDSLHIRPHEQDGNLVYTYEQQAIKAQLVARKDGDILKALNYAIAFPSEGKSQLLELMPRGAVSTTTASEGHLLPLPNGAQRLGARLADDGQLLLEMVTLSATSDELVIKWRDAGWEVRPSGLGSSSAFSLLCGRGNDVVYAWSPNPPDALQTLMLVRSPTDAELQAASSAPRIEEK